MLFRSIAAFTVAVPTQRSGMLQTERVLALVAETRREIEAELHGVELDPSV